MHISDEALRMLKDTTRVIQAGKLLINQKNNLEKIINERWNFLNKVRKTLKNYNTPINDKT